MKKRLAITGGGVISTHYKDALCKSAGFLPVALCDKNALCAGRELFYDLPFYTDIDELFDKEKPDTVLISTPPATHFDLAQTALERGIDVITEKPMCKNYGEIETLYALAEKIGRSVTCIYHWRYADEVLFLADYIAKNRLKISKVKTVIKDDYCDENRHILPSRQGLLGAWYDSGINVLSYIDRLLPLDGAYLVSSQNELDEKIGQPVYSHKVFKCGGTELDIKIDWREDTKDMSSAITTDRGVLEVSHTEQAVRLDRELIFSSPVADRLTSHYINLFSSESFGDDNRKITERLHRLLFWGEEK